MSTKSIDYICRYINHPEAWLVENNLMNMIQSEDYQNQILFYFDCGRTVYHWKQALAATENRLEIILHPHNTDKTLTEWRKRVNTAITKITEGYAPQYHMDIIDCARHWIATYSLLRAAMHKKIVIKYCTPLKQKTGGI